MKNLFVFVLFVSANAWTDTLNGQIEAQWDVTHQRNDSQAPQQWAVTESWQETLSAQLSVTKNGFGLATTIADEAITVDELFYDFSTAQAEWTVGRKPQEWNYSYLENALNWITDDLVLLREQFTPFGSVQTWCYMQEGNLNQTKGCAARASGWHGNSDWQLLLDYRHYWRAGLGLQSQLGNAGLAYVELYHSDQAPYAQLHRLNAETVRVSQVKKSQQQINLGAQWTSSFNLSVQTEWLWYRQGLSQQDWQDVVQQLSTPEAGLTAEAFSQPVSKSQYLLRLAQPWQSFTFENVSLLWPEANNSVLNQLSIDYKINSSLSVKTTWQHQMKGHVLRKLGEQDRISVSFQFVDGWQ